MRRDHYDLTRLHDIKFPTLLYTSRRHNASIFSNVLEKVASILIQKYKIIGYTYDYLRIIYYLLIGNPLFCCWSKFPSTTLLTSRFTGCEIQEIPCRLM